MMADEEEEDEDVDNVGDGDDVDEEEGDNDVDDLGDVHEEADGFLDDLITMIMMVTLRIIEAYLHVNEEEKYHDADNVMRSSS